MHGSRRSSRGSSLGLLTRAMEQSVSLWLEEDNTYDELVLKTQTKMQNEKDKDYEI